jgi:hypothetical protein
LSVEEKNGDLNPNLTFAWQTAFLESLTKQKRRTMDGIHIHYIVGGLTVLIGSIALIKVFDFIAFQSARRLLEMATKTPIK